MRPTVQLLTVSETATRLKIGFTQANHIPGFGGLANDELGKGAPAGVLPGPRPVREAAGVASAVAGVPAMHCKRN